MSQSPRVAVAETLRGAHLTVGARPGVSMLAILLTLVIVVLLTASVASTIVALRAVEERKRAREEAAMVSQGLDDLVLTLATAPELKGLKMEPARRAVLQKALDYYQDFVKQHANEQPPSPAQIDAQFHIAALLAKLGSMKSVDALGHGMVLVNARKATNADPESYPRLQDCLLKVAAPNEWMVIKGASFEDLPKHAFKVFVALQSAVFSYDALQKEFPQAVGPRDDLAAILRAMALLQSSTGGRRKQALAAWRRSADLLESLVKEQPDNDDYKVRLAESLVGAAKLQKAAKNNNAAIASYQRAIGIHQQLAAARPDDQAIAQDLATAQKEVAKIKPDEPKEAAPETADAAAPAESTEKPPAEAEVAEKPAPPDAAAEKEPAPDEAAEKAPPPAAPDQPAPAP